MMIGIIGAPNKGKSTLFSALTMHEVPIANRPFTTINPNFAVSYVTADCPETKLNVKCNPKNSMCIEGVRYIPINIVDVAGLVEGAHEGRGMGNKFLNDLSTADAFILVVDGSGKTDAEGNFCESCNPEEDVRMVKRELAEWVSSIISKHLNTISKRQDGAEALAEALTGLKIKKQDIEEALERSSLSSSFINWGHGDLLLFSGKLLEISKPMLVAFNKFDTKEAQENFAKAHFDEPVVPCSAEIELAAKKAEKQGVVRYSPSQGKLEIVSEKISEEQRKALEYISSFIKEHGTKVQELLNSVVFGLLKSIVVYPVEDENKYSDHFGNVLPDAVLMKRGSTAKDLAYEIHTDIGKGMLYAVDAITKKRLGKDYVLKDGDVIKIVSSSKPK
ncbi:MAG: redox-regulated ATPase YchF [Candidatus Micrarchaeia archaeon]